MRAADWQANLNAVLADWRKRPFAWGTADCVTFAGDVCLAVRGNNPLERGAADYADAAGAALCLEADGHASLLAALRARLGKPGRPVFAQPGDLLFVPTGDLGALAVLNGAMAWAPGDTGLQRIERGDARLAWRI